MDTLRTWSSRVLGGRGHTLGSGRYSPLGDTGASGGTATMPGAFPQSVSPEPVAPANRNRFNSHNVQHCYQEALAWTQYLVIKPVILVLWVVFGLLARLINVIYFDGNSHIVSGRPRTPVGRCRDGVGAAAVVDPADRVHSFVRGLEDNLTAEHQQSGGAAAVLPPFFAGSYTQALYMASSRARFLFVYLTNFENENSAVLFQKVVTHPQFSAIFRNPQGDPAPNVLIWGGDLSSPEAYQLANSLNVTKFPFLGLLCLTRSTNMTPQGPVKTAPKISLVSKIQGGVASSADPAQIIDTKFRRKMARYEPELVRIRTELRDKFMAKALLRQQDHNYQQSLARDRAKQQQRREAAELAAKRQRYMAQRVPKYRALLHEAPPGECARIAIKLKQGQRHVVQFSADADVQDIFEFTELCQSGALEDDAGDAGDAGGDEHFVPSFSFRLVSPAPPRETLNDYLGASVKIRDVACVYPSGLLIVEDGAE
ncbi:UBX domain-containing protein [[Candida] zeylanoides]